MKKHFFTFIFLIISTLSFCQTTISGVKLDETITIEGKKLVLNGAGIREKWWIDLYVGSLYLPKKSTNGAEVVNSTEAAAIKLDVVSGMVSSEKMMGALDEGFVKSTNNNIAPLKEKIDKFKSFFKEKFNKGDSFTFVNVSGTGIVVYKNGVKKGTVEGQDFKKALFGIWLSNNPADKNLKKSMLGI
ncbi:Chalcone isomerase [Flavobacterium sp. 9AF]|uniref:chalcone isomerase family protein n=1 Tax=Flavobacterium sp. 9AF TaxID=2653142 RepID=UPI0012F37070|nr:chalcone isomerase family protein [Flavobacterium sp. 9AF]VXA96146.1 Chalcone isomerase [Flavobacterium sp. 9AF]